MSSHPLRVYKNLLLMARRLPDASKREAALAQIRGAFRANKAASGVELQKMLLAAESKVSYLKIVTPRQKGCFSADDAGAVQTTTYGSAYGGAGGDRGAAKPLLEQRDYSQAVGRHHKSVRRQHFLDRGVAPPRSPMG